MTDQELRALVRDAVQRHLGGRPGFAPASPVVPSAPVASSRSRHPSHAIYISVVNTDDRCVIEPDAPCNHCDYCKSHGH